MFNKKYKCIIIFIIGIITVGLIKVNIAFTKRVKDEPSYKGLKIYYNKKPFSFKIDFKNYELNIDKGILNSVKKDINSVKHYIAEGINKIK